MFHDKEHRITTLFHLIIDKTTEVTEFFPDLIATEASVVKNNVTSINMAISD